MGNFDWDDFIDNLWERENAQGKRGVEGRGGYRNGKYYPYITPNGDTDIGPGFDIGHQPQEFKERAKKGFTKEELDSIVKSKLSNEIHYFNQKIANNGGDTTNIPGNVSEGGPINRHKKWDDLSMSEKAEMMKVAVRNGILNLSDIKQKYNEFAEGGSKEREEEVNTNSYSVGNLVNALYQNNPKDKYLGEPEHHYDFTQSEEWANAHGYYPDARGHRDDRVKKPTHPSHPSRGVWDGDKFVLTDFGMQNPNYTLFGLNDGGQDPQAILIYNNSVVLPELTVTPNENYFFNPYDNIELHYAEGGKIHIKPENRGKFTALKERTGHSATWFKEHGTPAQRKMATFALNSKKWHKHSLGGYLEGQVYDVPESEVMNLINAGYEIEYI